MLPKKECLNEKQSKYKLVSSNQAYLSGDKEIANGRSLVRDDADQRYLGSNLYDCPPDEDIKPANRTPVFDIDFTGSISNRITQYPLSDVVSQGLITGVNKEGIPIANFGEGSKLSFTASNGTILTNKDWMVCLIGILREPVGESVSTGFKTIFEITNAIVQNMDEYTSSSGSIGIRLLTFSGKSSFGTYFYDRNAKNIVSGQSIIPSLLPNSQTSPFAFMIGRNSAGKFMTSFCDYTLAPEKEIVLSNASIKIASINPARIEIPGYYTNYPNMVITRCIGTSFYDIEYFKTLLSLRTLNTDIIKNYE